MDSGSHYWNATNINWKVHLTFYPAISHQNQLLIVGVQERPLWKKKCDIKIEMWNTWGESHADAWKIQTQCPWDCSMISVFRRQQGGKPEDGERGGSGKWLMRLGLVVRSGGIGSVNAHTPFKNCFLESYGSPGHKLHWFSEVGVLETHLSSKSLKMWGTRCGSVQIFLSLRRS